VVTDGGACKDYPISRDDTLWLPANTRLAISLGPHCAVFRMRKLKSQVAKASTVCVEKIFPPQLQIASVVVT